MQAETTLAKVVKPNLDLTKPNGISSLLDAEKMAQHFIKSGLFKDINDVSKAVVKIQAGQELGIGPFASMKGIHVFDGKVELSSALLAFLIIRAGYEIRVGQLDNNGATILFLKGGKQIGVSTFTRADATTAGLLGKPVWQKFFRNMVYARALSNGQKWFAPEVSNGMPLYHEGEVIRENEELVPDVSVTLEEQTNTDDMGKYQLFPLDEDIKRELKRRDVPEKVARAIMANLDLWCVGTLDKGAGPDDTVGTRAQAALAHLETYPLIEA